MMDMRSNANTGDAGQPGGKGPSGYKSKLDEILAKAGKNNPIARAQASGQQPGQPAAPTAPAPAAGPVTAAPAVPPAPTPAAPANPNDRLQQILAMAGKTPAQRAQYQAQQSQQANAANFQAILQNYFQALPQDPRKLLFLDAELSGAGHSEEYWLRCYADVQGNVFWDLHGDDIDYTISNTCLSKYQLHEDYYRGITSADLATAFTGAKVTSSNIV